jgi:hypothetical protein
MPHNAALVINELVLLFYETLYYTVNREQFVSCLMNDTSGPSVPPSYIWVIGFIPLWGLSPLNYRGSLYRLFGVSYGDMGASAGPPG